MDDYPLSPNTDPEALDPVPIEPVVEPPAPTRHSALNKIFLGPNGIRAGWRLLIFLAVMLVIATLLVFVASPAVNKFGPNGALVAELDGFLAALLASLVMARIEKRSLADYGLPVRGAFGRQFWVGLIWGFLALTLLLVVIHLGHGFDFGRVILGGRQLVSYAALWAFTFLVVGFSEEYIFRGYSLATLSTGMGFWPSAVLLSVLFGAGHIRNPGEDWMGAAAAALIGLFFCLALRRTGSLWFAIGMHAGWDYAESFIYSVPDSGAMVPGHLTNSSFHGPAWLTGGTVGPEGSALVFVVIGGLFLAFNLIYRETRFPPKRTFSDATVGYLFDQP